MNPPAELKRSIRREALERRKAIPLRVRQLKDSLIKERLLALPAFRGAERVALYASFRTEVDTLGIIMEALAAGKEVLLPRVDLVEGRLALHRIEGLEDMAPGFRGIPEPAAGEQVPVQEANLLVVPGVAFDPEGRRVGYGSGFYDRLLPRVKGLRPIVALAYEEQVFPSLPREEHDISVDVVITDARVIHGHG
ncbi:MAG: 5-formyltetrahydrofolate cyclo-ligase [Nitrospirota bacterium]